MHKRDLDSCWVFPWVFNKHPHTQMKQEAVGKRERKRAHEQTPRSLVLQSGHKQEVEQEAAANGEARDNAPDFLFQLIVCMIQYVLLLRMGAGAAVDLLALATRAVPLVFLLRDL